jgi:CRISPR/Cas system-associated exonuclease Cas4 (RecB family)
VKTKTLLNLIKDKVDTLPPEQSFLSDLKATVSACNPRRPGSKSFKPSSLHCARQNYFVKIDAPLDASLPDYSGQRICESGSSSHEAIQYYVSQMQSHGKPCKWVDVETYIKEKGLTYLEVRHKGKFETKLYDTRYDLSFLCDGIIWYKGKYYILEIKTETDSKGLYREEADAYHKNQSVCYSLSLQINDIMWVYEERNFCVPKTFHTVVTEEDRVKLIMFFEEVLQAVKELKPPQKCNSRKTCEYCGYKGVCRQYH